MRSAVLLACLALLPFRASAQTTVPLRVGMVITESVRIAPGTYRLEAAASPDSAAITIRGDDIVVDFTGATLEGMDPAADPDLARGTGIRIDGGRNVRVRGVRVRGYEIGLIARGTRDLIIEDSDFSHNWKPRLFSLVEHESLVDWLSHHDNEADEWLRFGAGIYLSDVRGGEIRGNRIEQGMEGLMLVRSDSLRIVDNVIRYNSGVGIGLYRSSGNLIAHNHAGWNVRGFSEGFYRRGQDSANLLLYEQSSGNVVAFNAMTHGGDGLFLWAGRSTMDTGRGGSNDNLFYANDFSFAPTNAMEATFSRNRFIANRAEGSEYGLWGGYSYESHVIGNRFGDNRTGIAIEHGQDNVIARNLFERDSTAIRLWANPVEPSDWGYPRHRDTRSRDVRIEENRFAGNRVALRVVATERATAARNEMADVDSVAAPPDAAIRLVDNRERAAPVARDGSPPIVPADTAGMPRPLPGGLAVEADSLRLRPRSDIIVNEWGPYDYRSPLLWPAGSDRASPLPLRVLGPPGEWRVVERDGVARISAEAGRVGDTLVVTPAIDRERHWSVALEYRGGATVSPRGEARAPGEPVRFTYERFEPIVDWQVSFFTWPEDAHPREQLAAFERVLAGAPILQREEPRLDYMWFRPTLAGVPAERWALSATTRVTLPPGEYTLRTISDDAVRVWVDDRLVIDNWTPHDSRVDLAPIAPGEHDLRVQYYQVGGWTELRVEIVRGRQHSTGSPGPH